MGTPRPAEGVPPYQGEFLVGNLNVEELLPEAVQEQFVQAVSTVWEHDDVHIINITSALDRGGRVPLPIEGRKEGYGAGLVGGDRKSTRLNSSHLSQSRMPSSA